MPLLKKMLERLTGLRYRQEYLCVQKEAFTPTLHVAIVDGDRSIKDITSQHLFTGYCPLIFSFAEVPDVDLANRQRLQITFTREPVPQGTKISRSETIAGLSLEMIHRQHTNQGEIFHYKGTAANHHFLSAFQQSMIGLHNRLYNRKPGNVFLDNSLYRQVQIAYSVPRVVSLVTVGENECFNLFPTDLHGQVNAGHYIISLRHEGMACKQVEAAGHLVVSTMDAAAYKQVYALGKNHMQAPKPASAFDFDISCTANFELPLPKQAIGYRELRLRDSFIHGIHKLLLFSIIHEKKLSHVGPTLAHVHNAYASWRDKQGEQGNYLMR